jgi:mRNA interferase MazF
MDNKSNNDTAETRQFEGIARKGEIWHIEQGETTSTGSEIWAGRPAVIVSNDATNQKAGFVNVVYLTTSVKREMPYHIKVMSGGKEATALCEQIFAVDKSRISFYVGQVTQEELLGIDKALLFSLGISNTIKPNSLFTKWINAVSRYNLDLASHPLNAECEAKIPDDYIAKERDKYKMLYEQSKKTIDQLIEMNEAM